MKIIVGKMNNGRIVQIVKTVRHVMFSTEKDWVCVCYDFAKPTHKRAEFKWLKVTDTKFVWVKSFQE